MIDMFLFALLVLVGYILISIDKYAISTFPGALGNELLTCVKVYSCFETKFNDTIKKQHRPAVFKTGLYSERSTI